MTQSYDNFRSAPRTDIDIITPIDRVRWGPIVAGLFASMSVLVLLGVLGVAVGLSSVDRYDDARNYGIGAGIWGAISALAAFFFGGWISGRTAANHPNRNGMLQGGMVWMVAIPLMVYLLAGGLGAITRTATQTAGVAASAAANNPQRVEDAARQAGFDANKTAQDVKNSVTPERVEQAADKGGKVAWGTLVSLLLGLAAALAGGFVGGQSRHDDGGAPVTGDRTVVNP